MKGWRRAFGSPLALALTVAVVIAIGLLCPMPATPQTVRMPGGFRLPVDKTFHVILFFAAGWSWKRALEAASRARPRLFAFVLATIYAGALEVAQSVFTTTRSAKWGDLAAGALGAALGVALARSPRAAHPVMIVDRGD